jgi:hypothetical protein
MRIRASVLTIRLMAHAPLRVDGGVAKSAF